MKGPFDSAPTSPSIDRRAALPCPECCGEGFIETIGAPGYFDEHREAWMPSCEIEPCDACRGIGVQEHDEPEGPAGAVERHRTEDQGETAQGAESALPF